MEIIQFQRVSKIFHRHTGPKLIRHHFRDWFRPDPESDFYALKDISFSIDEGESVAIVGRNGAGKSTLLSLVCGLSKPEKGQVEVSGQLAAMLELGSGFHPDLTGAENVHLNASLLGFTRARTNMLFDSIVEFSGVAEFINEPLRTYSTGMMLRLAFSVALNLEPKILIIDEVLAVGDQAFQEKCFEKILEFRHSQRTLLCVSHAPAILLRLCDRALDISPNEEIIPEKASIYQAEGNLQEAARLLSPLNEQASDQIFGIKIDQLKLERNYGEAIRLLQARLAQFHFASEEDRALTQSDLAFTQRLAGDMAGAKLTGEQARNTLERLYRDQPDNAYRAAQLSQAYVLMEEKDLALKEAERAVMLSPRAKDAIEGPAAEENLALIQTIVGDHSRAISTLARLLQTPYNSWFYSRTPITPALLRLDPIWDPLRSDLRFQKLCEEKQP